MAYYRWAKDHNPTLMPTESHLKYLHESSHDNFLNAKSLGFVRSVEQVAGFFPHHLTHRPNVEAWDNRGSASWKPEYKGDGTDPWTEAPANATWLLTQIELVSLLLQETPMVYQSDHLPRMDQLSRASTRTLDEFETSSLEQLYSGEHFIVEA